MKCLEGDTCLREGTCPNPWTNQLGSLLRLPEVLQWDFYSFVSTNETISETRSHSFDCVFGLHNVRKRAESFKEIPRDSKDSRIGAPCHKTRYPLVHNEFLSSWKYDQSYWQDFGIVLDSSSIPRIVWYHGCDAHIGVIITTLAIYLFISSDSGLSGTMVDLQSLSSGPNLIERICCNCFWVWSPNVEAW